MRHSLRQKSGLIQEALEGLVLGRRGRGRRRIQLLDSVMMGNYKKTKEAAKDRNGCI